MTRMQLERAVAGATGESLRTVRGLGFGLVPDRGEHRRFDDDLVLAVTCPFCGHVAALPTGPSLTTALADCGRCDVEFDYNPDEVRVARRKARA